MLCASDTNGPSRCSRHTQATSAIALPATEAAAQSAALDYGQCIRDLAYTNIFAGDLLLKNFGVTRHGRVVFYDYDEISLLTECHFRSLPSASSDDEEMASEPKSEVRELQNEGKSEEPPKTNPVQSERIDTPAPEQNHTDARPA